MSGPASPPILELSLILKNFDIGNSEILRTILNSLGIDERLIVESQEWPHKKLSVYFTDHKKARALLRALRTLNLKDVRLVCKRLRKKDWETKWKEDFKPLVLTRTFGVVPMRLKGVYSFRGKIPVYIDADFAFGTGLHPTTKHMARFVDRIRGRFKSFWDVGTGSGILSIIAVKCGAHDIDAIDISPEAVKAAQRNFIANHCPWVNIKITDARSFRPGKKYDLVCANLITQELIEIADKLMGAVKPGKYLAVSGISVDNYTFFREFFARYRLRCIKVEKEERWAAVLYKKAS
jgi:ribosomal protein L11 methyltransferase